MQQGKNARKVGHVRLGGEEAGVLDGPQGVVVGPRVDGREVQRIHQHRHVIHLCFGIAFFCARVVSCRAISRVCVCGVCAECGAYRR